jgi:hypothetical protein
VALREPALLDLVLHGYRPVAWDRCRRGQGRGLTVAGAAKWQIHVVSYQFRVAHIDSWMQNMISR